MKFLIVDDSNTMRRIISNTVKRIGYSNIIEAENGKEAIEKLKENPDISIILSDWNMPEMNGLELLRYIRKHEKFNDLPFIMITTEGGKKEVITALKAGANQYIVKPFTPSTLKEKLELFINSQ